MGPFPLILSGLILLSFLFDTVAELLNLRYASGRAPSAERELAAREFAGLWDPTRQERSSSYLAENIRLGWVRRGLVTAALIVMILAGGFNILDQWVRSWGWAEIPTGLAFAGILLLGQTLLGLPFSVYSTFSIEERYGFNRSTPRVFAADLLKGLLLGAILGGVVFAGLIGFFDKAGPLAWLYAWAAIVVFQLLLLFIAPVVILPLFNRFEPVPEGELRSAIEAYARKENFRLSGIFTMDSSKRSSKANAFFTGFGRFRRLVLFDTLIAKHTREELLAVLAHEVGHFRRGHILKTTALAIASLGVMLFLVSVLLGEPLLFRAFRVDQPSVYASLIFLGILYSPFARLSGILSQGLSRKFEFEADEFSARSYGNPEALISALKKLSSDQLANLTPHPLKVLLDYSHPPILKRIAALRKFALLAIGLLLTSLSARAGIPEPRQTGVGVVLGEPTGLSGKLWRDRKHAFDAAFAYSFDDFLLVSGDYLFHFDSSLQADFKPYVGIGGLFYVSTLSDKHRRHGFGDDGTAAGIGLRIPLGIEWLSRDPELPIGVYLEVVPGVGIVPNSFGFIEGGIGARYYFHSGS
jgi:STE24 endopeptidase